MIFVAGAGGTAVAARAMRRIQRDLDRRFAAFKARRRARRRARTRAVLDHVPVRVDFDCMCLCGSCGYFVDEVDSDAELECPACGESDWIDLALKPLADRLRDVEFEERMRAPVGVRRMVLAVAAALCLGVGFLLVSLAPAGAANAAVVLCILVSCVVLPTAYYIVPGPLAAALKRSEIPHRWQVPLGLPGPDVEPLQRFERLEVAAADGLLTAPFSGRECLAYQVSVLFDAPGDARPPEWALQEQRATLVSLSNGATLAPEHVYLESAPMEVEAPPNDERDRRYKATKRFLRKRGLFTSEGDFRLFEARLEPGERVDVEAHARGLHVLRHSD